MIAFARRAAAHAARPPRPDNRGDIETRPTAPAPPVFHPMGAVRIVTPAEHAALAERSPDHSEARPMANFGVRHAYPLSSRRSGSDARSAAGASRGFLARALGHLLDALDAAPFDLAWPPSAHALSRAGWVPNPAAPAGGALGTRDAAPDAPDARDARDARGAGERGRLRGAA